MGMAELTLKRGSGNGMVSSSFNEKTLAAASCLDYRQDDLFSVSLTIQRKL